MTVHRIPVPLADNPYEVLVGEHLLDDLATHLSLPPGTSRVAVVTVRPVEALYGQRVLAALQAMDLDVHLIVVPDGEAAKTLATLEAVYHRLAAVPLGRSDAILALGGGVVGDLAGFAAATRMKAVADRHGFVVVLPGQERGDNAMGCWSWFQPEHRIRGRGEPAAIAGIVGQLLGETGLRIDARRIFVCGLSSGGAMAAILAATYPDLFAAAAIHSGLAYGSASNTASAYAAMANGGPDPAAHGRAAYAAMGRHARAVPTMVIHGSADTTVAAVNAHQVLEQAMAANRLAAPDCRLLDADHPAAVSSGQVDGGHAYTRSRWTDRRGALMHELLLVEGLGHAWSGGLAGGSHTDPRGPDATDAIARFFAEATQS